MRSMTVVLFACAFALGCSRAADSPPDAPTPPEGGPAVVQPPSQNPPVSPTPNPVPPGAQGFVVNGTVEFLDLEGGCWVIKSGTENYLPTSWPTGFKQDGLAVTARLQRLDHVATTCMVGPAVSIISIQRR